MLVPIPRSVLLALAFALATMAGAPALAQEGSGTLAAPPVVSASAPTTTVDVDVTTGETVRGTLLELVPGDHFALRLASGEERRYPWAMVRGFRTVEPASPSLDAFAFEAPGSGPAQAAPTIDDPNYVSVHVEAVRPQLRLEVRVGTRYAGMTMTPTRIGNTTTYRPHPVYLPVYAPICDPPCDLPLRTGLLYELRVRAFERTNSLAGVRPVRLWVTPEVTGLTIDFGNRSRFRRAAWITVGVLPLLGVGAMVWARHLPDTSTFATRNSAMFWTGVGLLASPSFTFAVPLMTRDRSRVTVHRDRPRDEPTRLDQ